MSLLQNLSTKQCNLSHNSLCRVLTAVIACGIMALMFAACQSADNPAAPQVAVVVAEDHSTDFSLNNITVIGTLAFVISLASMIYTYLSYTSQRSTEKNTKNVPIEDQRNKFKDLSRHEYRNLVCGLSAAIKFFDSANGEEQHRHTYPSESNLLKMKVQPEDVVMEINPSVAASVAELRLLLRNYNIEIDVASQHLSRQTIIDSALHQDFDNLLFKPLFLVKRAYALENDLVRLSSRRRRLFKQEILPTDICNDLFLRTVCTIVQEHFSKIKTGLGNLLQKPELLRFLSLLDKADGLNFGEADHTNAIKRSVSFLLKDIPLPEGSQSHTLHLQAKDPKKKNVAQCNSHFAIDKQEFDKLNDNVANLLALIDELKTIQPDAYAKLAGYEAQVKNFSTSMCLNFMEFFPIMLQLDAIVELRNIGMVNF